MGETYDPRPLLLAKLDHIRTALRTNRYANYDRMKEIERDLVAALSEPSHTTQESGE